MTPLTQPQNLVIDASGQVVVTGAIGITAVAQSELRGWTFPISITTLSTGTRATR